MHEVASETTEQILWEMPLARVGQLVARQAAKYGTKVHRPLKYKEALAKLNGHSKS